MAGDELGVQIDCAQAGPRIQRWRTDKQGTRQDDAHSLTPGQFDEIWKEIDGTGWPNMHDCTNGTAGKNDPIYLFDVKDDQNRASFQCQSQTMPYPYNDIVDPLDLAAQNGRKQLGDDEPAENQGARGQGQAAMTLGRRTRRPATEANRSHVAGPARPLLVVRGAR